MMVHVHIQLLILILLPAIVLFGMELLIIKVERILLVVILVLLLDMIIWVHQLGLITIYHIHTQIGQMPIQFVMLMVDIWQPSQIKLRMI